MNDEHDKEMLDENTSNSQGQNSLKAICLDLCY